MKHKGLQQTCDVNGLLGATGHAAVGALHSRELHQGLTLEGHHHHITERQDTQRSGMVLMESAESVFVCEFLLSGFHRMIFFLSQQHIEASVKLINKVLKEKEDFFTGTLKHQKTICCVWKCQ